MGVAISLLYAAVGVMVAEGLLLGTRQILGDARITLVLCVFFVASAFFLDAFRAFLRTVLDRTTTEKIGASLSSGVLGVAVVLGFVGFNLWTKNALDAFYARGASVLVYLLAQLSIPVVVTFSWIAGNRRPRRAALYGALAGFFSDALVRLVLWSVTKSIVADPSQPDTFGTALVAAVSGAIQTGFYAGCGGLALDLTRAKQRLRNLTLALFGAIGLWSIGFRIIGGAFNLPEANLMKLLQSFGINLLDYGGWMIGLAICPTFAAALQRDSAGVEAASEARFLQIVFFVPTLITCNLIIIVLGFDETINEMDRTIIGLISGIFSGVAWQLSAMTNPVWNARLNILAGLFAVGAIAFLARTNLICGIPLMCR